MIEVNKTEDLGNIQYGYIKASNKIEQETRIYQSEDSEIIKIYTKGNYGILAMIKELEND